MSEIKTDEILVLTANAAVMHAGDPQWFSFFIRLHQIATAGLAGRERQFTWMDDGSLRHQVQFESLLNYASNVFSQRGDDGIIRRIFRILGIDKGFYIEFGATDGIILSNCRALAQRGWSGCFIEAEKEFAGRLAHNYRDRPDIICLNALVVPTPTESGKTIDAIAAEHFPGRHVDFLSIDVDGTDHLIFEKMQLRPSVVCLEGGWFWHPEFRSRVPEHIAAQDLQQPLPVLIEIGKTKAYTPICFNQNIYFVVDELAHKFPAIRNDAVSLWKDAWFNESQTFRDFLIESRQDKRIREIEGEKYAGLDFLA